MSLRSCAAGEGAIFPTSKRDLVKVFDFYQRERKGLGYEFLEDVQLAVRQMQLLPQSAPEIDPGIRRQLCQRFRYGVLYRVTSEQIEVLAVGHLKRHPNFWRRRLKLKDQS